ncbi:MAG: hypothetical protein ACUVRZ_13110 [Desulfobacca sp.]|uniref:hypothetical protein n=1 Tax=Desulfobacca sp. TaxID=2067990 RepID=UPI00404ACBA2
MADFAALAKKTGRLALLYLRNILTNLYRRLLILVKHLGIYWQKRRLGTKCRKLGNEVYRRYAAGDVNPLLQEEVKDLLAAIQEQVDHIESRRQVIQEIRLQIKATSYRLPAESRVATAAADQSTSEES